MAGADSSAELALTVAKDAQVSTVVSKKKKRQMNYFFYFLSIFFQAVASEASAEAERIRTESAEALVRNSIHICPTYHEIPSENRTKFISLKIMFSGASDRALRVRPLSV